MRALSTGLFGLCLLAAGAGTAAAQSNQNGPFDPYSWNVYNEGPGIKLGDGLVFHPGLATELGYDSNVLLNNTPAGAGMLRLRARDLGTHRGDGEKVRLDFSPERSVSPDRSRPRRTAA